MIVILKDLIINSFVKVDDFYKITILLIDKHSIEYINYGNCNDNDSEKKNKKRII